MFSSTGQRVSEISEQLWMFQRYEIVMEYEKRLIFAPPFTVIFYAFYIIKKTAQFIIRFTTQFYRLLCNRCCKKAHKSYDLNKSANGTSATGNNEVVVASGEITKPTVENLNSSKFDVANKNPDAFVLSNNKDNIKMFNYWTNIAQKYSEDCEKEVKEKSNQKQIETNMNKVREDLGTQKKTLQRLNDRVISLEKAMTQNQSYLEQIRNLLTQRVSKSGLLDRKKRNFIHILSRESPYIFTNIPRFFVYEKLVPWECAYDLYDVS
jgi:hypothetical protein